LLVHKDDGAKAANKSRVSKSAAVLCLHGVLHTTVVARLPSLQSLERKATV
jgi:hypothetical protein